MEGNRRGWVCGNGTGNTAVQGLPSDLLRAEAEAAPRHFERGPRCGDALWQWMWGVGGWMEVRLVGGRWAAGLGQGEAKMCHTAPHPRLPSALPHTYLQPWLLHSRILGRQ